MVHAKPGRDVQKFLDELVNNSSHVSPNVFTSLLIGAFDLFLHHIDKTLVHHE